jgi:hypothetical protein
MKTPRRVSIASFCLAVLASLALAADPAPAPKGDDIVAALPVIPDATFKLTDFGGVGDGKAFNTDAFKNAITAIAKAGGGHLFSSHAAAKLSMPPENSSTVFPFIICPPSSYS